MKSLHALFAVAAFLPSLSLAVSSGQSQDIPQRPSWDYCSPNLYCHTDVDCRNTVDCRQKAWKLEKLENTRLNIIIVFIRTMIGGLSSAVYFSTHIPAGHGKYHGILPKHQPEHGSGVRRPVFQMHNEINQN
ncbi:hypothetical protein GX48_06897 [Paracoccidioides brasiliensis]|nr:hypothetical protein GX48_06897 [Paracoccidioides brasiliensis]